MQTAQQTSFSNRIASPSFTVGQLAKNSSPTLKPNTAKDFTLGRQPKISLARTHARGNNEKFNKKHFGDFDFQNLEKNLLHSPNALHEWLTEHEIKFYNLSTTQEQEFLLPLKNSVACNDWKNFIRLVHVFTLINRKSRMEKDCNNFISQAQDYLSAVKVIAINNDLKRKRSKPFMSLLHQFESVYIIGATFTRNILIKQFQFTIRFVDLLINYLIAQKRIEKIAIIYSTKEIVFQVIP
jgi:hypothetical protein